MGYLSERDGTIVGETGGFMKRTVVASIAVLVLVAAGCSSSDPTTSDEYQALEQELALADQQLAETEQELADAEAQAVAISAERDALAQATDSSDRHDNAARGQAEIRAILDDPEAFGTEDEIADLLATHAKGDALMDDDVFGAVGWRTGFFNTLYGMADARVDTYDTWLCDDGSQGGALWMWHGTNAAGNPFELAGISLTEHDEDGLISYELVTYPYSDEHVRRAFSGSGS